MSSAEFEKARESEEHYHAKLYEEEEILKPGTWMSKPLPIVMELLESVLDQNPNPVVLDLGSGPGRNAIPIAMKLQKAGQGRLVGTDLLDEAVCKLKENADKYGVAEIVEAMQADVEHGDYEHNTYDYIVACGCLEHVSSKEALRDVISRLQYATTPGGIHCITMNTEVSETKLTTGEEQSAQIELNLSEQEAISLLEESYSDWRIIREDEDEVAIKEEKYEEPTEFSANTVVFAARKPQN
ncbi:class I SAM-dependent methyltransferase [Paenibacillus lemnae]|uniref:Class I SAM-dependent methyltransferase n=1 Tax=Paenibacillus lemnae TaxID=1330551 RepID=A0A848MAR2_PAELE|nr:class I SAM-dependent methyltransferase [Paenibacillus lemnae]NMO97636.1 class I SAM-dependent methyltransferase [Paenibacillus lemnae]